MLPKPLQEAISKLPPEAQPLFGVVVLYYESHYEARIEQLEVRIKELEDQLSKHSKNSNKPPSSDGYKKPSPKSRRPKTGRKPGGQKGHKGTNLKMVAAPSEIQVHRVSNCARCQADLSRQPADGVARRQVYDLPPIELRVIEHQVECKRCVCCGHKNKGAFPAWVSKVVQYGPNFKGLLTYLQDYQLLPHKRLQELVEDLFGHSISTGTLYNIRKQGYERLAGFEQQLKVGLRQAHVAGFDETGIRLNTKLHWLHSCSTDQLAYFEVHAKRGQQAMDDIGILPNFTGIAVHDAWKSYFAYPVQHALCSAHLLRELDFLHERHDQSWAQRLAKFLVQLKTNKEKAIQRGKTAWATSTLARYRQQYLAIVKQGLKANPPPDPVPNKKRGRPKKSKARNLLERLVQHVEDYLRFIYDFRVPFDNNASERDLRMMKVKLKISGCFRSWQGAQFFARIRSYILTARKQGLSTWNVLKVLFCCKHLPKGLFSFAGAQLRFVPVEEY